MTDALETGFWVLVILGSIAGVSGLVGAFVGLVVHSIMRLVLLRTRPRAGGHQPEPLPPARRATQPWPRSTVVPLDALHPQDRAAFAEAVRHLEEGHP